VSSRSDARRQAQSEAKRTWQAFPELPGTHLSWRRTGLFTVELTAPRDLVWASVKCPRLYSNRGDAIDANRRHYEVRRIGKPKDQVKEVVDVKTGATVMTMTGTHFAGRATTRVTMPNDVSLTFPVAGSATTATMSAVNDAGDTLIRYRVNKPKGGVRAIGPVLDLIPVEVTVTDAAESISSLALVIATTSGFARSFFRSPGGA
jgi:hypothetical protein